MAISISGHAVRLREVVLKDKPSAMLDASPKATVPVLVADGAVIDESLAIMQWALGRHDPENWLSRNNAALIRDCDGPFKFALDRYKYAARYEGTDPVLHREAGMEYLKRLEAQLAENACLSGNDRGMSDIAIFPFVRQFRIADEAWFDASPLPRVHDWLSRMMNSGLFQSVMHKYPPWKGSGEEFLFPGPAAP